MDIPPQLASHQPQLCQTELVNPPSLKKDTTKREYRLNASVQFLLANVAFTTLFVFLYT